MNKPRVLAYWDYSEYRKPRNRAVVVVVDRDQDSTRTAHVLECRGTDAMGESSWVEIEDEKSKLGAFSKLILSLDRGEIEIVRKEKK